jgi:sugar phosphate isomerase/epimerase
VTLCGDDLIASVHVLARAARDGKARVAFPDRMENAASGGFAGIGTSPGDYLAIRDSGLSDEDMDAMLDHHGLVVGEIDSWPLWLGEGAPDELHRRHLEAALHMAERFGPVHHAVVPFVPSDPRVPPRDRLVKELQWLARAGRDLGIRIALEFVPWGPVANVRTAWALVEEVDDANCGLTLDFWHHLTGAADNATLRTVPGNRIHAVHFTDGLPDPVAEPDPLRRTQVQRRFPGEGSLPIRDLVRLLDEIGANLPYTVEAVSRVYRDLSDRELVTRAGESSRRVLVGAHQP